jgi:hypothetical protein
VSFGWLSAICWNIAAPFLPHIFKRFSCWQSSSTVAEAVEGKWKYGIAQITWTVTDIGRGCSVHNAVASVERGLAYWNLHLDIHKITIQNVLQKRLRMHACKI